MATSTSSSKITISSFRSTLSRYDSILREVSNLKTSKSSASNDQKSLVELDKWKDELKGTVQSRAHEADKKTKNRIDRSNGYLTKDELQDVVRWKLKRGKNRPTLPSLIASNETNMVKLTTEDAFIHSVDDVKACLTQLCLLRGIGPATATAILSITQPNTVPFFSDEAFRWVVHGSDWRKKIDYTMKEYLMYYDQVQKLMQRLEEGTTAKEVERVGWVLGQEDALGLKHDESVAKNEEMQTNKKVKGDKDVTVSKEVKKDDNNQEHKEDDGKNVKDKTKEKTSTKRKNERDKSADEKQLNVRRSKRFKTTDT